MRSKTIILYGAQFWLPTLAVVRLSIDTFYPISCRPLPRAINPTELLIIYILNCIGRRSRGIFLNGAQSQLRTSAVLRVSLSLTQPALDLYQQPSLLTAYLIVCLLLFYSLVCTGTRSWGIFSYGAQFQPPTSAAVRLSTRSTQPAPILYQEPPIPPSFYSSTMLSTQAEERKASSHMELSSGLLHQQLYDCLSTRFIQPAPVLYQEPPIPPRIT